MYSAKDKLLSIHKHLKICRFKHKLFNIYLKINLFYHYFYMRNTLFRHLKQSVS